jgi:hypothetical protein
VFGDIQKRGSGENSMRVPNIVLKLAAAAVVTTAVFSPAAMAVAAPASPIAGAWQGPFLSTNFIFEFQQAGNGWTGRYRSDKSGKWADLQNVVVADGTIRFSFESQPPSSFELTVDKGGKALKGSAKFGPHAALPLTLTRAS